VQAKLLYNSQGWALPAGDCRCVTVLLLMGGCVLQWYVDVVLALLERAGDFCSDDIWHRVVQLITNNEGSQVYAAGQVVEVLRRGAGHEALMCMAAYVLGECGHLVQVRCLLLASEPAGLSRTPMGWNAR